MADILINFSNITIPTPEPFSMSQPAYNRETLAYVVAQILNELKLNGFQLMFPESSTVTGDLQTVLTQIKDAIKDLQFGTITFGTPEFSIKITPKSAAVQY